MLVFGGDYVSWTARAQVEQSRPNILTNLQLNGALGSSSNV